MRCNGYGFTRRRGTGCTSAPVAITRSGLEAANGLETPDSSPPLPLILLVSPPLLLSSNSWLLWHYKHSHASAGAASGLCELLLPSRKM